MQHLSDFGIRALNSAPADAGGVVPAALRRGTGGGGRRRPPGSGRAGAMSAVRPEAAGTGQLLRFAVRRDRLRLPIWIAAGAALIVQQSLASQTFYDTPEALAAYRASVGSNPATIALSGPPVGLDTVAGAIAFEISFSVILVAALMAMFTVVRHTRADEEVGRTELVRATQVGRHAPLLAAIALAAGACVLLALAMRRRRDRDRPARRRVLRAGRLDRGGRPGVHGRDRGGRPAQWFRPGLLRAGPGRLRRRVGRPGDRRHRGQRLVLGLPHRLGTGRAPLLRRPLGPIAAVRPRDRGTGGGLVHPPRPPRPGRRHAADPSRPRHGRTRPEFAVGTRMAPAARLPDRPGWWAWR